MNSLSSFHSFTITPIRPLLNLPKFHLSEIHISLAFPYSDDESELLSSVELQQFTSKRIHPYPTSSPIFLDKAIQLAILF
jgi:hypothetical protein